MTFLLVEDDLDDVDLFADAIKVIAEPVTIVVAHNGIEALEMLRYLSPPPDHIFMDINMPLMNGMECFKRIRKDLKLAVPVTILSTKHTAESNKLCDELMADCIEKPTEWGVLTLLLQKKVNQIIALKARGNIL